MQNYEYLVNKIKWGEYGKKNNIVDSPGMEQGNTKQAYNILYVNKDGSTGVYESH